MLEQNQRSALEKAGVKGYKRRMAFLFWGLRETVEPAGVGSGAGEPGCYTIIAKWPCAPKSPFLWGKWCHRPKWKPHGLSGEWVRAIMSLCNNNKACNLIGYKSGKYPTSLHIQCLQIVHFYMLRFKRLKKLIQTSTMYDLGPKIKWLLIKLA